MCMFESSNIAALHLNCNKMQNYTLIHTSTQCTSAENVFVCWQDTFIEDVRLLLRVLLMFLPLPIFWALFDQQVTKQWLTAPISLFSLSHLLSFWPKISPSPLLFYSSFALPSCIFSFCYPLFLPSSLSFSLPPSLPPPPSLPSCIPTFPSIMPGFSLDIAGSSYEWTTRQYKHQAWSDAGLEPNSYSCLYTTLWAHCLPYCWQDPSASKVRETLHIHALHMCLYIIHVHVHAHWTLQVLILFYNLVCETT